MEKIILYLGVLFVVSEAFFISNREFRRIFNFVPRNDIHEHSSRQKNSNFRYPHRYPENIRDQIYNYDDNQDNYEERNDNYGYYQNDKFLKRSKYNNKHIHHYGCEHQMESEKYEKNKNHKNYNTKKYEMADHNEDNQEPKPKVARTYKNNKRNEENENDTHTFFLTPEKLSDGKYKKDYVTGVLVTIPKTRPVQEDDENENHYNPFQFIQRFFHPVQEDNSLHEQIYDNFQK